MKLTQWHSATGDAICQTVFIQKAKSDHKKDPSIEIPSYDLIRTLRIGCYGLLVSGPLSYGWYKYLDKFLVLKKNASRSETIKLAIYKVFVDELVFGPITLGAFFYVVSLFEGKTPQQALQKLKDEFWTTFIVDLLLWPGAQYINFRYLPTHYRILYISTLNIFWNSFLSFMQHDAHGAHSDTHAVSNQVEENHQTEQQQQVTKQQEVATD